MKLGKGKSNELHGVAKRPAAEHELCWWFAGFESRCDQAAVLASGDRVTGPMTLVDCG